MTTDFVVIDLETTGLNPTYDQIIEVAAVKISRGLITDEFSSLIACDKKLNTEIIALTGITDEMLIDQPKIEEILPALSVFIGEANIIAHNAEFDRGFLSRYWPDQQEWIDSVTLAQIVYPCEPSYALASLTRTLNINNRSIHRALSDAMATAELFIRLQKELTSLPGKVKAELISLCVNDSTPLADLIRKCCQTKEPVALRHKNKEKACKAKKKKILDNYVLDINEVGKYLGPNAEFRERIEGFEERPQQLLLAHETTKILNNGGCLLAEVGTGTGKSLAYLLPAALFSLGSGRQVAVSTHTRNLQEQLLNKDVPMLSRLLDKEIRAVVLKGRGNYLCNRLYRYFCLEPSDDFRYFLMRVAVWRAKSASGDGGEMSLNAAFRRKWQRICAAKENCAPFCPFCQSNSCYVQKARIKAAEADILILNHSLLIAASIREGGFLPDLPYIIIDEAQHLENATEDQLTTAIDFFDILNLVSRYRRQEKGKNIGVIPSLTKRQAGLFEQSGDEHFVLLTEKMDKQVDAIISTAEKFYDALSDFFREEMLRAVFLPVKIRILPDHRKQTEWQTLLRLADELCAELNALASTSFNILDMAQAGFINEDRQQHHNISRVFDELFSLANQGRTLAETIQACISAENDNYVAWVEYFDNQRRPSVGIAPIEINKLLKHLVYEKTNSLIMTSATLTTGNDFSYFKQRVGLDLLPTPPKEMTMPSPFFYREQALFSVVDDLPDWSKCSEIEAATAIAASLIKLLSASRGRAIILFTSHLQLKNVYKEIRGPLNEKGISVLAHGISGDPSMLLARLRKEENCCILGAASFWEGVDVIGEALSLIIIVRLPFWPPNTPLAATRMEKIEAAGNSPFWQYSLPQALIRFKQGFGRLIRTDTDSGVFCVLDKRIISKQYGACFIKSLPQMEQIIGNTDVVAEAIKKWLK